MDAYELSLINDGAVAEVLDDPIVISSSEEDEEGEMMDVDEFELELLERDCSLDRDK